MATATQTKFKRELLDSETNEKVTELLQTNLINLIDLALLMKQAHWNVVGPKFRSIHLQLDEIIATARDASDEIAERIAALGVAADGRAKTISESSDLGTYPLDFVNVGDTVSRVADELKSVIDRLRQSIEKLGDLDPVSEDMLIGFTGPLEKHLWMLQTQEEG